MNLVSIPSAVALYGLSKDTLYASACIARKNNGIYPKWYIEQGDRNYIDMDEFERPSRIENDVWRRVTDSEYGVYWAMINHFKVSDFYQAKILAERSKEFKSEQSWRAFMSNSMFSLPVKTRMYYKYTMNIDYLRIMTRWIYEEIKKDVIDTPRN